LYIHKYTKLQVSYYQVTSQYQKSLSYYQATFHFDCVEAKISLIFNTACVYFKIFIVQSCNTWIRNLSAFSLNALRSVNFFFNSSI